MDKLAHWKAQKRHQLTGSNPDPSLMSTEKDAMCPESAEAEDTSLGTRPLAHPRLANGTLKDSNCEKCYRS